MDSSTKKQIIGDRLKEALKSKKWSQAELRRRVESNNGPKISSGHLSMIIKGDRPLDDNYAEMFAEVLGIEQGYLKGFDNYTCRTYDEYLAFWSNAASVMDDKYKKVARVLVPLGYSVGMVAIENDIDSMEFDIKYQGETAVVPVEKIDEMFEEIKDFIRTSTNRLIKLYRDDSLDDNKEA